MSKNIAKYEGKTSKPHISTIGFTWILLTNSTLARKENAETSNRRPQETPFQMPATQRKQNEASYLQLIISM